MESNLASCRLEAARAEARLGEAEDEVQVLRRSEQRLIVDRYVHVRVCIAIFWLGLCSL